MTNDPLEMFRIRVKSLRTQKGISLKEIAEYVDCTEATMQRYESGNGIKNVPYENIIRIAEKLGVSPAFLMGWEEPMPSDADLLADIVGDRKMMDCIKKISEMDSDKREKVYDYVDYIAQK